VSAYRAIVIEHFRRPRNRAPLPQANRAAEGANPLCGDRIRIQLRVDDDTITDARFMADACALCIATASLLTEHVRGLSADAAAAIDGTWVRTSLEGDPPAGRARCAMLPVDTLRRAVRQAIT
jgi:nitrogen fixation NifU-like protein